MVLNITEFTVQKIFFQNTTVGFDTIAPKQLC